jgi:uncharacterized membrane protein YeiB
MKSTPRIEGFDLARALAIWGMVTVHFWIVLAYHQNEPAWLRWCLEMLDGRAAALFVILAGVGISLRAKPASGNSSADANVSGDTQRSDAGRVAAFAENAGAGSVANPLPGILLRRGLFLLVVGFVNLVIWKGDILRVYGVSLCLAAWLVGASDRKLLTAAGLFIVGFIGLMLVTDYGQEWDFKTFEYANLWSPRGISRNLFYNGFRSVFPWTGLLVFGLWLGRRNLADPRLRRRTLVIAASLALATEIASALLVRLFKAYPNGLKDEDIVGLFGTVSMPPLPMFLIAASSTAVAVICASLTIAERFAGTVAMRSLVACGQMAFTWYVVHIVVGLGGLVMLGLAGSKSLMFSVVAAAGFFVTLCAISLAVRSRGRRGPLEWLMRRLAG